MIPRAEASPLDEPGEHLASARSPAAAGPDDREVGERLLDSVRFRKAVVTGDLATVRRYLERDPALIHARDHRGRSVFVLAHLAGHPDIAALFRERGVRPDLVEASIEGDWERVGEIGEEAAGIGNLLHPFGGTGLHAAALFGHGGELWRLYGVGGDPNSNPADGLGFTPARLAMLAPTLHGAGRSVTELLGNGADVNAPQLGGSSILHGAAATGSEYLAALAIRKGGNVDARDEAGRTPLDLARELGHQKAVGVLARQRSIGRDCRTSRFAYDADGGPYRPVTLDAFPRSLRSQTAGSAHFRFEQLRELVALHPDLAHSISDQDEMAVEACAHTGRRDIARYLLDRGVPMSLPTALSIGDLARARALLAAEPDRIRERGAHDFPVIWYPAIGADDVAAAELLVEFGIDLAQEGKLGQGCLHWSARMGRADLVAYWIEAGADVNARDFHDGATPLDFALARDEARIADLLRSRGGRGGADLGHPPSDAPNPAASPDLLTALARIG